MRIIWHCLDTSFLPPLLPSPVALPAGWLAGSAVSPVASVLPLPAACLAGKEKRKKLSLPASAAPP